MEIGGDLIVAGGDITAASVMDGANVFATTMAAVQIGGGDVSIGGWASTVYVEGDLTVGGRIYGQVQIGSWAEDELTFHSGYWEAHNPVTFKVPSGYTEAFTFADSDGNDLLRLGSAYGIQSIIADADVQINGDLFVSGEIHDSRRRLEDEKKAAELDELRTTVKDLRAELDVAMAALRAHGLIAES